MLRPSVALILLLLILSSTACAAATVALDDLARTEAERIVLGTVAQIEAPAELAGELAQVDLGPAPLPGGERRLTAGYIKMRLRRSGVDCGAVEFVGAQSVRVQRPQRPAAPRSAAGEATEDAPVEAAGAIEVRRGTRVHLTVASGSVTIGADATLLEDAVVGGRARMRVLQTRETVVAQLTGASEALIDAGEVTP